LSLAAPVWTATRPRYGGTLRVAIRESFETPESAPAVAGFSPALSGAGNRLVYTADENTPAGRPFLDSVEIQMARPLREQSIDLELGRADVVQLDLGEPRRATTARRLWTSSPVRILLIEFTPRVEEARVREALSLAVDRTAIHNVLLQRHGDISSAVLPQWLSGYAFVFPASQDLARARSLLAGLPAAARTFSLGATDASYRRISDRIALNARDIGLTVTQPAPGAQPDARLTEVRITLSDPARALAAVAAALGLPEPPRIDSPEAMYAAERTLLEGFRIIPLFHLPDIYGVSPRVKGGSGITPLGEWRFENLWLETARP
jgi:hypothetical protein